jgi:hypothetical protein
MIRSFSEAQVAGALVAAVDVGAGAVAADARVGSALVGVDARQRGAVQHVARPTFATERAVRVHAPPAAAHVRTDLALVQVLTQLQLACRLQYLRFIHEGLHARTLANQDLFFHSRIAATCHQMSESEII